MKRKVHPAVLFERDKECTEAMEARFLHSRSSAGIVRPTSAYLLPLPARVADLKPLCAPSIVLSALASTVAAGCSSGSAAPTSTPTQQPTQLLAINFSQDVNGYQCYAIVFTENAQSRDVTGLSTWSTSDNTIATVNSVGFVTVYRIGDVAVRARYQDMDAFVTIHGVVPGGLSYYYRAFSGWVRDAQDNSTLPGATVLILDGANSGRTTTVRPDGAYLMVELQPGTFTVRFSRAGYATKDLTFTLPGDKLISLDAALSRSSS